MSSTMAANGQTRSKKILIFAVFLVLATFPHSSYEFAFKFGGDDDDDVSEADKKAPMRRQVEKKFKFHKIERIYAEDEDEEESNKDDDNGDNDEEISNEKKSPIRSRNAEPDAEDDVELQFERVRKGKKPKKADKRKKTVSSEEDSSIFDSILSIFSFGKQKKKVDPPSPNGIIDWILWIGEKTGRIGPLTTPTQPKESDAESWISYLNRWPFNSIFPFDKPEKSIKMSRQNEKDKLKSTRRSIDRDNDEDEEPMSEAHFENLLHSLPGFVVNAKHISADQECRHQLQVFHRQLRAKKLWTLQMLDATGKITSGLLRGNINQFGDFDLCIQVKAVVKVTPEVPMRIRGKYCLAHIEITTDAPELKAPVHLMHGRGLVNGHLGNPHHFLARYTVANWGVCIPNVCPVSVVEEMLEINFSPYNRTGIEFNVEINDNDCAVRPVKHITKLIRKDEKFAGVTLLIFIHLVIVVSALMIDYSSLFNGVLQRIQQFRKQRIESNSVADENSETTNEQEEETPESDSKDNEEKFSENVENNEPKAKSTVSGIQQFLLGLLRIYSPKRTLSHLLSREHLDMEFPVFHLLKIGLSLMLYVCLKFIMIGHLPISNRDKLIRFFDQPLSVFFRMPIFYSDVLLLLSGFTVAYQLSEEMAEKRYIQLLKRLTTKITRYLPTMFLVLAFQTWILPKLGTGPLWGNLVGQHAQFCEEQMWRNAFSVQNAIDFEDTCSPMTIQIALQIQLYLLGPLLVWLYYTDADAVFFVYGGLHALSVAARYSRTNLDHLSMTMFHGIHVSKFYRSANLLYSSPITRATPYLLGIGAGLLYRSETGNIKMPDNLIPLGWVLSISSIFWCFWSPSSGMNTEFVYSASDAASYAAWSPLVSGLAICWLILMLSKRENSILNILCSSRPILFLSRISYPIQLVTYIVVLQNTASVRETIKFHTTDLFNLSEIGEILFYATIIAFVMDVPVQQIRHILVNRLFIEKPSIEESESEAEPGEHKESDSKNDATEEGEGIWSSDPDEEAVEEISTKAKEAEIEEVGEVEEEEEDLAEEAEIKKRP